MGCATSSSKTGNPSKKTVGKDIKIDSALEKKQEELHEHEFKKPDQTDLKAYTVWKDEKERLTAELKQLEKPATVPLNGFNQSSCYSLTVDEISSDAEPSWMRNSEERLYTQTQMLNVLVEYCKPRVLNKYIKEMLSRHIICEVLASYVAEAFYFPPSIFETSFHGNGWICLAPRLNRGKNLVAVRAPTGIQVEWTFSTSLRFELTFEWDVKRQNFKCYYTFYRTRKKPNGTMEHKASDHIRVKADQRDQPFGGVMAVEVNLATEQPQIKIFFDGETFHRFTLPVQRKEFAMYKLNPEQFRRCTDINFYLGAKIRHITSFSYA